MNQKRTFAIGDVHGCLEELNTLLQLMRLTSEDHLIFAGDLVDKGPDSAGVVRRVRELSSQMTVSVVQGNHEEGHLRWMAKPEDKKPVMKRHEEYSQIHANMTDEDRDFMKTFLLFVHLPEMGIVVTHGGVPDSMKYLPDARVIEGMSRQDRDWYGQMCRLRSVDSNGRFVGLYEEKPEHVFWATRYDGRFGQVFFGHQPFVQEDPKEFPFATGLDLACVHGGLLCAVELNEGTPNKRSGFLAVRAKQKYAPFYSEKHESVGAAQ